jgi:hypothetical protein
MPFNLIVCKIKYKIYTVERKWLQNSTIMIGLLFIIDQIKVVLS